MQKTIVRLAVAAILASMALFVMVTEDYWREKYFKDTSNITKTLPGEVHVGVVRWNTKLLIESYNEEVDTCYLRDAESNETYTVIEQCNYKPPKCDLVAVQ